VNNYLYVIVVYLLLFNLLIELNYYKVDGGVLI